MSKVKSDQFPMFARRPPDQSIDESYQLLRVKPSRKTRLLILSGDALFSPTHFDGRRTRQCSGSTCDICLKGATPRWYGYVACCNDDLGLRGILEFPATCVRYIDDYLRLHTTLRGAQITATRKNAKNNSAVHLELVLSKIGKDSLPESFNLVNALARIWQLKPSAVEVQRERPLEVFRPTGTDPAAPLPGQGSFLD
jgi:hypothetical protein